MPTYRVHLTATALVRATCVVSAASPEAAEAAALRRIEDLDWTYDGVFDDTAEVSDLQPLPD